MSEKRNALWTAGLLGILLLAFTIADLLGEDRLFSDAENRMLAQKPTISAQGWFSGDFSSAYEEYATDQFVGRDAWIGAKTRADIALQKKEMGGVYLGKDGWLLEAHAPQDYPESLEDEKLKALKALVERYDAKVMLVPSADVILSDKLPAFAEIYNQEAFLEKVKKEVGGERYIDVYSTLKEHKEEYIYYRTDHHWTTYGAALGFAAWKQAAETAKEELLPGGKPGESAGLENRLEAVSENFLGTLHSRVNFARKADVILALPKEGEVTVTYDFSRTTNSLYEEKYLDTKNQYGYFLDDNHGMVEIATEAGNGKTLFVIKDSFANCMIPFLAEVYEKIYVVDLRYYNGRLFELMDRFCPEKGMDVLVLYNCIQFLEEFKYF